MKRINHYKTIAKRFNGDFLQLPNLIDSSESTIEIKTTIIYPIFNKLSFQQREMLILYFYNLRNNELLYGKNSWI
jgi:hypothetical protein